MSTYVKMEDREYVALQPMKMHEVGFGFFPKGFDVAVGDIINGGTYVGRLGDCQCSVKRDGKIVARGELSSPIGEPIKPSGPYGHILFNPKFLQIK